MNHLDKRGEAGENHKGRQISDDKLPENGDRFRSLYDNMIEGSALHNLVYNEAGVPADYRIIEVNPAFEAILGISRETVIGKLSREAYGVADPPYFEIYKRVAITGKPEIFESYFSTLDKHFIIKVYRPYKGSFATIFENITERKLAEQVLKRSEYELKRAQQITHIGSFFIDLATNQVTWTDELYKMYGFDPSLPPPLLNESQKLFIPESWELLSSSIANTAATGIPYEIELTTIRKDGSNGWMWARGEAARDPQGKIVNLWGAVQDITDRKLAEEALKKSEAQLKELNGYLEQRVADRTRELETTNKELHFHINEIEQFNYIASHDLQEPLNALTNFTNLIHEEYAGKLDEDGNKSIDFIYHSTQRMRLLLKDLLAYSLLGKDRVKSRVDCKKVVGEVLDDLSRSMDGGKIDVTVTDLPAVNGNAAELRLLFQNLIENAIKFHKKDARPKIHISAENIGKAWKFSIKDNGIGIVEKDKENIFIIFKRMVNRTEYEGTGIGLALCKKIIELHGGKIWVESNEEVGSTFMFTIPI